MLRTGTFLALMLVVVICGCTQVASVAPVGEYPRKISPADWDGTWLNKEQPIKIKVADPQQGLLQVAWVEDKGGRLMLESYEIELRAAGEWTFGNLKTKETAAPYLWGLVQKDQGQILIWTPDQAYFRKLVETGVLPGSVTKGGDVVLQKLTPEQLQTIMSPARSECFNWKAPLVFIRLGK
jgi:hypothetical protein